MKIQTERSNRILSIDALRGFDMLMILFADRFYARNFLCAACCFLLDH